MICGEILSTRSHSPNRRHPPISQGAHWQSIASALSFLLPDAWLAKLSRFCNAPDALSMGTSCARDYAESGLSGWMSSSVGT